MSPTTALTSRERAVLDLERCWWTEGWPTKEVAIRDRLGMSKAQYYAALDAVVGTAAALAYDPLVVLRVRRAKQVRRRARFLSGPSGPPGERIAKRSRSLVRAENTGRPTGDPVR